MACVLIAVALLSLGISATADTNDPTVPSPPFDEAVALPAPPAQIKLNFLSATLGDHMVLQRAPQAATVWGHTTAGAIVTTTFDGKKYTASAGAKGTWRQQLPPMPASMKAFTLTFASSVGERASLNDVLFGDVYICGGQSNMQFSMPAVTNASAEQQLANKYPNIRLFTVGQKTRSPDLPLGDLQTILQPWAVASNVSIRGDGAFSYFSAVCWLFGRQISDSLSPTLELPLGLISDNWGGTQVEAWAPLDAYKSCDRTGKPLLYNAMIYPYTVGPMALSGFTWYQGEANVRDGQSAASYSCLFPAMITGWRNAFKNPNAYFGFVQLSTWCGPPAGIAEIRDAQMAALRLPNVGYATNADHGAGCVIHPPPKQYVSMRLGNSALALQYGKRLAWRSPSYASAAAAATDTVVSVTVSLHDVTSKGLTTDVYPFNYVAGLNCTAEDAKAPGTCAWGAIEVIGVGWLNATVSVAGNGRALLLQAPVPAVLSARVGASSIVATSYGWGGIPMMNAYDQTSGLPVLPWNKTLTAVPMVVVV